MNTVYLTGLCVHTHTYTHFPLRPLGEPGSQPSEGSKARLFCDVSFSVRQGSLSRNVSNLYSGKAAGN